MRSTAKPGLVSRRSVLAGVGVAAVLGVTASGAAAASDRRTIYLAGDSTCAPKAVAVKPEVGWGMALPYYLAGRYRVKNYALSGRSSKSFYDEGVLGLIRDRIVPGDILIAQFGHNDQKAQDETLYSEPWSTYQEYLRIYLDTARAAGAIPVLATSAERRRFDADNNAYSTLGDYPAAMRDLAACEQVPLIDVQAQTIALWQQLGPEETKNYFMYDPFEGGRRDNTHFQVNGGSAIARFVALGLYDHRLLGTGVLRHSDRLVPADWFEWPEVAGP